MQRLYHSFPRPASQRPGAGIAVAGAAALDTLIRFGMVLTPEDLEIPPNPGADTDAPVRTAFPQERACFTLMTREELFAAPPGGRSHADRFGPFAIGLDPIRARALGAFPVVYFYGGAGEASISYQILFRLRELRTLMSALALIEAKAGAARAELPDALALDELGVALADGASIAERIAALPEAEARQIAGLFDTDRVPAWNLIDWIDTLLNFFQTADSKSTPNSLAYYQQREWRVVRLFWPQVQCHPLSLAWDLDRSDAYPAAEREALRARLRAQDPSFFSDHRLDLSYVLLGAEDLPFFDFVEEVIVPRSAERLAEEVLSSYRFAPPFRKARGPEGSLVFIRRRS